MPCSDLGAMRQLTGDYPGAAEALAEALGISRDLGDRLGQANALLNLGIVRWRRRIIRARPVPWQRRWASSATSVTGWARPTPSLTWGPCAG